MKSYHHNDFNFRFTYSEMRPTIVNTHPCKNVWTVIIIIITIITRLQSRRHYCTWQGAVLVWVGQASRWSVSWGPARAGAAGTPTCWHYGHGWLAGASRPINKSWNTKTPLTAGVDREASGLTCKLLNLQELLIRGRRYEVKKGPTLVGLSV